MSMHKFKLGYPEDDIIKKRRYNPNSEAFRVTKKIFDEFYNASIKNKSKPIIVMFPKRSDVSRYREDNIKRYSTLLSYFDSVGYKYIDLMGAFKDIELDDLFAGHYTPIGNKLVAQYILSYLNDIGDRGSQ